MSDTVMTNPTQTIAQPAPKKKPFYMTLWGQVLIGVAIAMTCMSASWSGGCAKAGRRPGG